MGLDFSLLSSIVPGIYSIKHNENMGYYLAGMLEGDGCIKMATKENYKKGGFLYPQITIVFADKDLPLAHCLAKLLKGTINKGNGKYYVLSIYSLQAIHYVANLVFP